MNDIEIKKLIDEMSLEEKIGEMQQIPGQFYQKSAEMTGENDSLNFSEETVRNVGSTLNVVDPELIISIQKKHIEQHPHHIPMLFMRDIIHGFHTTFPIPLAQGCSFDDKLVSEIARATAKEASASGIHVTFSPMVDLVRDARWGRVMESFGEDPYLMKRMAKAVVDGYQGDDLKQKDTICSCVKHFAAYGAVEGGREYGSVDVSERNLRNYYLAGYKSACDAKCGMLMTAFNEIAGIPCTANKKLMREILRHEWEYDGVVITDYGSLNNMQSHRISENDAHLSKLAIEAGVDIEMCINRYQNGIPELLETKQISMEQIDEAVYRILKLKNRLGLFENPYKFADVDRAKEINRSAEMLNIALESVHKTSVLLKNEEKILPINTNEKIAFIGPFLEEKDLLGGWVCFRDYNDPTIKDVIENEYENFEFSYSLGCKTVGKEQPEINFCTYIDYENDEIERQRKIDDAVEKAKNAEKVVLFLGEHPRVGGELKSKIDITIPIIQQELFEAVSKVNDNIVVVLFNHRPLDLRRISAKAKAILTVWFPGTQGAKGVVDMLFGKTAPTGKLSMSFPYSVGQCPIYYNMLPTDHSAEFVECFVTGYCDSPLAPLYSFGHGLTYTDFEYSNLRVDKKCIKRGENIKICVDITNTGERDGEEIAQLYLRDSYASISRPVRELKGYKKAFIRSGETVTVEFILSEEDLKFYNADLDYVVEPGEFEVFVGTDSTCTNNIYFNFISDDSTNE